MAGGEGEGGKRLSVFGRGRVGVGKSGGSPLGLSFCAAPHADTRGSATRSADHLQVGMQSRLPPSPEAAIPRRRASGGRGRGGGRSAEGSERKKSARAAPPLPNGLHPAPAPPGAAATRPIPTPTPGPTLGDDASTAWFGGGRRGAGAGGDRAKGAAPPKKERWRAPPSFSLGLGRRARARLFPTPVTSSARAPRSHLAPKPVVRVDHQVCSVRVCGGGGWWWWGQGRGRARGGRGCAPLPYPRALFPRRGPGGMVTVREGGGARFFLSPAIFLFVLFPRGARARSHTHTRKLSPPRCVHASHTRTRTWPWQRGPARPPPADPPSLSPHECRRGGAASSAPHPPPLPLSSLPHA